MPDDIEDLVPEFLDDDEAAPQPPRARYGNPGAELGDIVTTGGLNAAGDLAAAGADAAGELLGAGAEAAGEVVGAGGEILGAAAGGLLDGCSGCSCVLVIAAGLLLSAGSAPAVHLIR